MSEQVTFTDIRTTPAMERTGEQWRALAAEAGREAAESFERCDSDGFLSQWASQQMQSRYFSMAAIADEGHICERPAVFDLAGNLVSLDDRTNDWGNRYWTIATNEGRKYFSESNASKLKTARANNEKKGYRLGWVMAKVEMTDFDWKFTDEIVSTTTSDWYGDLVAAGKEELLD